jgi:Mn-dependent DtxR family transcriptional regulator
MTTTLKPEMEARIADLAKRLGYAGPDAAEKVLKMALDGLDARAPRRYPKMTPAEMAAEIEYWSEIGRRNRALHPFDDDNPPSKVWQDELYDEHGLPK